MGLSYERLRGVKKLTWCIGIVAILSLLVGAVFFGGSWLARYEITKAVDQGIYDAIIVDSTVCITCIWNEITNTHTQKHSSGYQAWQDNYDHGHALLYQDFYFYNLTNLDEIKQGINTHIKVQLHGPYAYVYVHLVIVQPPRVKHLLQPDKRSSKSTSTFSMMEIK
jgi:hypothetical protein